MYIHDAIEQRVGRRALDDIVRLLRQVNLAFVAWSRIVTPIGTFAGNQMYSRCHVWAMYTNIEMRTFCFIVASIVRGSEVNSFHDP